jgi:hypothetical protein
MIGIALPYFPSAYVATSVMLTLRCVLRSNSTGDVQGVWPVSDTILKKSVHVVSLGDLGHNVLTFGEYFFVGQRSTVSVQSADHELVGATVGEILVCIDPTGI